MPEESRMSIVTGDTGRWGARETMTSRGVSRGEAERQSIQRAVSSTPSVMRHRKNAKKSQVRQRKQHPPLERKVTSPDACARVQPHITQSLKTSKKNFYLCIMSVWELEIQSRFRIGPAVGFSIYLADTEYDYSEFILFLLFISIHFKWEEPWTD